MNERLKRDYETFENGRKRGVEETLKGAIPVEVYDETLSASNGNVYATIEVVGEPPDDPLPVYAYLVKRNPKDAHADD